MITQQEFEAILDDPTKRVEGDIVWRGDPNHWPASTFRAKVLSAGEHSLDVIGRWNPKAGKLSYALLRRGTGRIYALDMGRVHRNPTTREHVGPTHKHRWTDAFRDKQAYVPRDITASWDRPVEVWRQFCAEATVVHTGRLGHPASQEELSL